MTDIGDTVTAEIDGEQYEVEIVDKPIVAQAESDFPEFGSATIINKNGRSRVTIRPKDEASFWRRAEFEAIDDHDDWTLVDVGSGENGIAVTIERDADE